MGAGVRCGLLAVRLDEAAHDASAVGSAPCGRRDAAGSAAEHQDGRRARGAEPRWCAVHRAARGGRPAEGVNNLAKSLAARLYECKLGQEIWLIFHTAMSRTPMY